MLDLERGLKKETLVLHNEYVSFNMRVLNYWMNAVSDFIPEIGAPLIRVGNI